jgi:hypothetical protein
VDAGFTVVEPFVFESKVSRKLSTPEHYFNANLKPEGASTYFDTTELHTTGRFVSFDTFSNRVQRSSPLSRGSAGGIKDVKRSNSTKTPVLVIDAVLHFDWDDEMPTKRNLLPTLSGKSYEGHSFYWCDDELPQHYIRQKAQPNGTSVAAADNWYLSSGVAVGGALCVSPTMTISPREFSASYFSTLFEIVANRSNRRASGRPSSSSVSVAFLNYRKHAFTGYVSATGSKPFTQKNPSMSVGHIPMQLAIRFHNEHMSSTPFVALQIRTGKAWVLSDRDPAKFKNWLSSCAGKAVAAVRVALTELPLGSYVYIASDMYNDGWKGGESCPPEVCAALTQTKLYISQQLRPRRFEPALFPEITQDVMGISGAVDAAMCVKSNRFVHTTPSSLGQWVHDQRASRHMGSTTRIKCDAF